MAKFKDNNIFEKIATGRSIYSTYFLLAFMVIAPTAFFTEHEWLEVLAWTMFAVLGLFASRGL